MTFYDLNISQDELNNICKKYLIKELSLFGLGLTESFNKNSDIDLLVTFENKTQYSLFDIVRVKEAFEMFFNRPVDIVNRKAVERSKNIRRKESILNNAKVIYAS